jgi:hypothetical protein
VLFEFSVPAILPSSCPDPGDLCSNHCIQPFSRSLWVVQRRVQLLSHFPLII